MQFLDKIKRRFYIFYVKIQLIVFSNHIFSSAAKSFYFSESINFDVSTKIKVEFNSSKQEVSKYSSDQLFIK
jgi:hypothetical protein